MLSGKARAALQVLRSEAHGSKECLAALSSFESSMGDTAPEKGTPGSQSVDRARADSAPGKSSGKVPPQFAAKAKQDSSTGSATAPNSFVEMMKSRRGSAQKRK